MSDRKPLPEPILIIPFDEPITVNGAVYTEMTLREPTGRHVLDAEKHLSKASLSPHDMRMYQLTLISLVSDIPFSIVRNHLPISKITEASNYLQAFIEAGTETGASA